MGVYFVMSFTSKIKSLLKENELSFDNAVFIKKESESKNNLNYLESLVGNPKVKDEKKLKQQISYLKYGIKGENKIEFELLHSYIPMLVLHDIRLEYKNSVAQIDYLIITTKNTYILESKNYYGNIEINADGDFIRWNGKEPKGMYNPVFQNKRHIEIIKKIYESVNIISNNVRYDASFDSWHKNIVVFTNDNSCIYAKHAPDEIKSKVIKVDNLVEYIRQTDKKSKKIIFNETDMRKIANLYLENHKPIKYNYSYLLDDIKTKTTSLKQELIDYRKKISKRDNIKAYYIFNNKQLDELLELLPCSIEELTSIAGFGSKKCEKYGKEILEIIKKTKNNQ